MDTDNDSVTLVYEEIKKRLEVQQSQRETYERKASMLIAFAGVTFAFLMGARDTLVALPGCSQKLLIISIFLFVISVILALIVSWVYVYRVDPDPKVFAEKYISKSSIEIKKQLISNFIDSFMTNNKTIKRNAKLLRATYVSQGLAFCLLGISLLISVF